MGHNHNSGGLDGVVRNGIHFAIKMEDRDPRVGSRYVIEKSSSYTWWENQWQSYADRLDAVELEGRRTGSPDLLQAGYLIDCVKNAEAALKHAGLVERWDLSATTLYDLMTVTTWDVDTIRYWLCLPPRVMSKIGITESVVPPDVVSRIVVPLALEQLDDRRHRAWCVTVAEIVLASSR